MALTDKERDELLAKMSRKIESSTVLNGGFDKLVTIVESIKERQSEQTDKLDQISLRLYEPTEGLFSRVQQLENDTAKVIESVDANTQANHEAFKKIEKHIEKIDSEKLEEIKKTAHEANDVTKRLKRIGGEDLEHVQKTVDLNKKLSTLYWGMIAAAIAGFGNLVWQFISHH